MPQGSFGYAALHFARSAAGRFRSHCVWFGLSLPFMMSRIENETTSFPVRGMLKSMTALEYLFQTVTCAMTPGTDTLTMDTRVSTPPVGIGYPVAPFSETFQYGTSSVAAGTLSYAQVTA